MGPGERIGSEEGESAVAVRNGLVMEDETRPDGMEKLMKQGRRNDGL